MGNILVKQGGALTTIQDLGRIGYQKFGIPVTGVMDEYSFRLANYLVGNSDNTAVLEITYLGCVIEFKADMVIAITGAKFTPKLNGNAIPLWESVNVKTGDVLTLGAALEGARGYIAFSGEIDVPAPNGSKSTFLKSKIGGFLGRALMANDELNILVSKPHAQKKRVPKKYIPNFPKEQTIRVVLGPQDDFFTDEGINTLFSKNGYTITKDADRMGIRLEGDKIAHKTTADIISDGAVFGSIQVPANGLPIILMADRQTTGGYTKIGTVIKEDLCKLAQMTTGAKICFEKVDLSTAHELYKAFYDKLRQIKEDMETYEISSLDNTAKSAIAYALAEYCKINGGEIMRKFRVKFDGECHEIEIEEISGCSEATKPIEAKPVEVSDVKEKVVAFMPGNIVQIMVSEGDKVSAGQPLLVLEALKMENEITSPIDGVVKKIYVEKGAVVDAQANLIDIG